MRQSKMETGQKQAKAKKKIKHIGGNGKETLPKLLG